MIRYSAVFVVFVSFITLLSFKPEKKINVEGAWKIVEVQVIKKDGSFSTVFPTESEAIFIDHHYSFIWTTGKVTTNRSWQLSDSSKVQRFNEAIINSGNYDMRGSVLTTRATVSLHPMFVGGVADFNCSFKEDTLLLTGISVSSADHILHPIYSNGSHTLSKLVRMK